MPRRLLTPLALLLAAAALGVAGCGDDDEDSGDGGGAATEQRDTGAAAGGPLTVSMKNIEYIPKTVTAKVGQKITWTNDDSVAHTVTKAEDFKGAGPESDTIEAGQRFTYAPTSAGTIPYFCEIHPNQKGTIVVAK